MIMSPGGVARQDYLGNPSLIGCGEGAGGRCVFLSDPNNTSRELNLLAGACGALGVYFVFQAMRGDGFRSLWLGNALFCLIAWAGLRWRLRLVRTGFLVLLRLFMAVEPFLVIVLAWQLWRGAKDIPGQPHGWGPVLAAVAAGTCAFWVLRKTDRFLNRPDVRRLFGVPDPVAPEPPTTDTRPE